MPRWRNSLLWNLFHHKKLRFVRNVEKNQFRFSWSVPGKNIEKVSHCNKFHAIDMFELFCYSCVKLKSIEESGGTNKFMKTARNLLEYPKKLMFKFVLLKNRSKNGRTGTEMFFRAGAVAKNSIFSNLFRIQAPWSLPFRNEGPSTEKYGRKAQNLFKILSKKNYRSNFAPQPKTRLR